MKQEHESLVTGNAVDEGQSDAISPGWFIGHFVSKKANLRHTNDVEVKWGIHHSGDEKLSTRIIETSTTLTILISGSFLMKFGTGDSEALLERPGDYALFAPGAEYKWYALAESVVLTVRWPSIPNTRSGTAADRS